MIDESKVVGEQKRIIDRIITERLNQGISQTKLSELTGIKQPAIARIEKLRIETTLATIIKLLEPLGLKVEIVPMNDKEE